MTDIIDTVKIKELRAKAEAATPGPWRYRPLEFDDWGYIRGPNDDATVAIAKFGEFLADAEVDFRRERNEDPSAHNAAHIAAFDPPTALALLSALEDARALHTQAEQEFSSCYYERQHVRDQLSTALAERDEARRERDGALGTLECRTDERDAVEEWQNRICEMLGIVDDADDALIAIPRLLDLVKTLQRQAVDTAIEIADLRAPLPPASARGGWISTEDALPEKPGKASYEQIPCLIFLRGDVRVSLWNCEHLVWDDSEGDDFMANPREPSHWMPLPNPPIGD